MLFRHKIKPPEAGAAEAISKKAGADASENFFKDGGKVAPEGEPKTKMEGDKTKDASPAVIRELLEKNLKWSQIIYEQNRRINGKLFWSALANWARVLIILVPLILAVIFLPSLVRDLKAKFGHLLGGTEKPGTSDSQNSLEQIIKLLPLKPAQQEQIKGLLK